MKSNFEHLRQQANRRFNVLFVIVVILILSTLLFQVFLGYKTFELLSQPDAPESIGKMIGEVVKGIEKGRSE